VFECVGDQLVEHDGHRARAARRQRGAASHVAAHAIAGAKHIERAVRHRARERRKLHFAGVRQERILQRRHAAQSGDRDVERFGQRARRRAMALEHQQRLDRRKIVSHAMLQLAQQQRGGLGVAPRALVQPPILRCELRQRGAQADHLTLGVPDAHQLFDAVGYFGARRGCAQPDVWRRTVRPLPRGRRECHDRQQRHLKAGLEAARDRQHNRTSRGDDHGFHPLVHRVHGIGGRCVRDAKVHPLERTGQRTRRRRGAHIRFRGSHDHDACFGHVRTRWSTG